MSRQLDDPTERTHLQRVILDTNVFVGAAFNRRSASAQILNCIRVGDLHLVWDDATRTETRSVLTRIPPIRWADVADMFDPDHRHLTSIDLATVHYVEDPADRKFAALSLCSRAVLISSDNHLLDHRGRLNVTTPRAFIQRFRA